MPYDQQQDRLEWLECLESKILLCREAHRRGVPGAEASMNAFLEHWQISNQEARRAVQA